MKKLLLVYTLFFSFFFCDSQTNQEKLSQTITKKELKDMLYIFSSDEFEGRETGQKGQKKAVNFIKQYYEEVNVPPAIDTSYFQYVPLQIVKTPDVSFSVDETNFEYYQDFISFSPAPTALIEATEMVYAGFGINDSIYSDYKTIDVKNKIVFVNGGEPKDTAGKYILSGGREISEWSNGRQGIALKKEAAKAMGAKALIIIDNSLFRRYSNYYKRQDKDGPSKRLSLANLEDNMHLFLASENLWKIIAEDFKEVSNDLVIKKHIKIDYKSNVESLPSENVAAIIRGSEKPDEYIIISAHLDHLGMNGNGDVYNGADDDGSGTVAILEIAEAFKMASDRGYLPKRSVIFLHVTGEEKGLLGSKYYTDINPIVPLNQTVANLNIDMIGRIDPKRQSSNRNYVYLIGSDKLSSELHNLSEGINKKYTNLELDYTYNDENDPNRYYYRSDHYNFAKNNIPVIFYFNGTHNDYHGIGDTPDKIEYDLLEKRTRLIFLTAWEIANRNERLKVDIGN